MCSADQTNCPLDSHSETSGQRLKIKGEPILRTGNRPHILIVPLSSNAMAINALHRPRCVVADGIVDANQLMDVQSNADMLLKDGWCGGKKQRAGEGCAWMKAA